MKYFEIIINADLPVTGKYPQVKDLKIDFHKARASQWGEIREWKSENDIPDLDNFVFQKGSKLTDIVTNSFVNITSGIFISEKTKSIFNSFIINGNFYPITIYEADKKHGYYFLWYEIGGKSKINWNDTIFIEYNKRNQKFGKLISVNSSEDYKNRFRDLYNNKGDDWDLIIKKIVFIEYFDVTPTFDINLICNEKVKKAIEENQLTGFDFRPIDVEIVFED
jgi:hypothetical protein